MRAGHDLGGPRDASSLEQACETGVAELQKLFSQALDARIPTGSRLAFIEFPYDTNVGNHMMWLAGMRYFAQRGARVAYATHINGYDPGSLRRAIGDGLIVFNGGVGLSALWPRHTEIKRRVVREFPNNPILIFPSTVAFKNDAEQDSVRDVFRGHRDVSVMARDATTYQVMKATFPEAKIQLVPDSAFMLGRQARRSPADHSITWLVRNDHESIGYEPPPGVHTFDWAARTLVAPTDFPLAHYQMRLTGAANRLRNSGAAPRALESAANRTIAELFRRVSERMLEAGNDDMDRGRVVVTDRFHTHILAILRRQPVVLLVDAYGKNKASYDSWTHRFPNVHLAHAPAQALEIAQELARGS